MRTGVQTMVYADLKHECDTRLSPSASDEGFRRLTVRCALGVEVVLPHRGQQLVVRLRRRPRGEGGGNMDAGAMVHGCIIPPIP